jgi:murein L,D-transpeptidase YcbB/YkuD
MHMRVIVGKPERQTPSLFAIMANVVINPPWGVPPTILKNDVLPGLEKSGKTYMAKKGLKVYDKEGKRVKVSIINAHNYKSYTYKQDPGDDNSLGYVKFNLPNPWDIYLHDTPHRGDFVKRYRALSSGCIRLQQPQEMAIYILSQIEKRNYTPGKLDSVIETHKTKWEILKTKIPVHITYLTAFEDTTGMHIQFTKDIYDRDDKLISLLQ